MKKTLLLLAVGMISVSCSSQKENPSKLRADDDIQIKHLLKLDDLKPSFRVDDIDESVIGEWLNDSIFRLADWWVPTTPANPGMALDDDNEDDSNPLSDETIECYQKTMKQIVVTEANVGAMQASGKVSLASCYEPSNGISKFDQELTLYIRCKDYDLSSLKGVPYESASLSTGFCKDSVEVYYTLISEMSASLTFDSGNGVMQTSTFDNRSISATYTGDLQPCLFTKTAEGWQLDGTCTRLNRGITNSYSLDGVLVDKEYETFQKAVQKDTTFESPFESFKSGTFAVELNNWKGESKVGTDGNISYDLSNGTTSVNGTIAN